MQHFSLVLLPAEPLEIGDALSSSGATGAGYVGGGGGTGEVTTELVDFTSLTDLRLRVEISPLRVRGSSVGGR